MNWLSFSVLLPGFNVHCVDYYDYFVLNKYIMQSFDLGVQFLIAVLKSALASLSHFHENSVKFFKSQNRMSWILIIDSWLSEHMNLAKVFSYRLKKNSYTYIFCFTREYKKIFYLF